MELKFLLEKYKKLGFSERRIKELTLEVSQKFGLHITSEHIIVKDTELKIQISGTARTHFVLIKPKLEVELQKALQEEGLSVTKIF